MVFPHPVLPCLILIRLRCHLAIYEKAYYKNGTARVYHHNRRQADANAQLEPYGAVITHWHLTKMLDFQIVMIRFNYIMQLLVCVKNVRK